MWQWLVSEWRWAVPLMLGWLAVCWAMPHGKARSRWPAVLLGLTAFGVLLFAQLPPTQNLGRQLWFYALQIPTKPDSLRSAIFYLFAATAVGSAAMMITDRNPVYAALWFALTTLGVCGLFMLNAAPFLAAATIVVYAGAIVVTFLFVIMLAQQAGATNYDQRAYQPAAASLSAFLLLGCFVYALHDWARLVEVPTPLVPDPDHPAAVTKFVRPSESFQANQLSKPTGDDLGSLRNVGRSLFTDYLYAVELAGTVLLIATIGAIAIAPRRSQGTF